MIIDKLHCFWGSESALSQWHPCSFQIGRYYFNTAEQYMMWCKADLFDDLEIAGKLLQCSDPRECKALGRAVKNFVPETWDKVKEDVVFLGNLAKFSQNVKLFGELRRTWGCRLVEASPYDKIWGTGLNEVATREYYEKGMTWPGLNLLGITLEKVRNVLVTGQFFG